MEELVFATVIDGIVTFVFFLIWQNEREIRGRLMWLFTPTLIHTLLFPLMVVCYSLGAYYLAEYILSGIYLFSTPVLFFYFFIYLIALVDSSRMNRMLAISSGIFIINLVVQALCAILACGHSQGG